MFALCVPDLTAPVRAVTTDGAVVASGDGIQGMHILAEDEDLAHVAGLSVLGSKREDGDVWLAVDGG